MSERNMALSEYKKLVTKKKGKGRVNYSRKKVEIDGHKFFKKESIIYQEFKLDPDIEILEIEPKFVFQEAFVFGGEKIAAVKHKPDFKIKDNRLYPGRAIIVEVKSVQTEEMADYRIRKRLLLKHIQNNDLKYLYIVIIFDGNKRKIEVYDDNKVA